MSGWRKRSCGIVGAASAALLLAACGGGTRQDANEPTGNFPVQVSAASWKLSQRLAERTHLVITVRNAGKNTIPNIAVTICNVTCAYNPHQPPGEGTSVGAFAEYLNMPNLASHSRPVWVVDQPPGPCDFSCASGGPGGAVTAYSNTWALGTLKPGATAKFEWALTAMVPGKHVVAWEIAAGLNGKAKAVLPGGGTPRGAFNVRVTSAPRQSFVNDKGQIVTSG